MNKYNHGTTIIEILLSVVIISLVMVFLFTLLVQVKHEDDDNQVQSQFLIDQSTIVENVEEDITDYGVSGISACNIYNVDVTASSVDSSQRENFKCVRINYAADYLKDNVGYLMIYKYYTTYDEASSKGTKDLTGTESKWMIRYIRGSYSGAETTNNWSTATTLMKELPNDIDLSETSYARFNNIAKSTGTNTINPPNAAVLVVPIMNTSGVHYDVSLPFLIKRGESFTCSPSSSNVQSQKFSCVNLTT